MAEKIYPLLSTREREGMVAEGRKIFILDQYVVEADTWLQYHPGGGKAILHMVGRDATDEVTALHSVEAKDQMKRYRIGRIEERWTNFVPPIQGGTFRLLSDENKMPEKDMPFTRATVSGTCYFPCAVPLSNQETALRKRCEADRHGSPEFETVSPSTYSTKEDASISYLDSQKREKISLDMDKYPPLDFVTQDSIVKKYRALNDRIKAEGLYQCNYAAYAIEISRYVLLSALVFLLLKWQWYVLSAFTLGCLWHQLVFSAHDAGHMGITHDFHVDTLIGIIIADFIGGLSLGWWKSNHNIHHIVTNSPEHDPDIEHMPFLAVSHRLLGSLKSTFYERVMEYDAMAKLMLSMQKYTYFILLSFGRFNLYHLSWQYLLSGKGPRKGPAWWHRQLEIVGMTFFWFWYGYGILYKTIPTGCDRFLFLMVSHMTLMPLHAQFNLSHFAMSTSDLGPHESFPQRMLRTSMDIQCPPWLDFFHGGLQFQVIHHLYPRIPRHNLRRTQKLVQEFCKEVGIPYASYGFVDGNQQVLGRLAEVSQQAAILAQCQDVLANGHVH